MKLKTVFSLIFVALSFVFAMGCTSGSNGVSRIKFCPSGYDPMNLSSNKEFDSKLELKPGQPFEPGAASYEYQNSQIYYNDKARDIRIHLSENQTASGEMSIAVNCVGGKGINQNMEPVSFSIPIIADLQVDAENRTKIRTRIYNVDLRRRESDRWLQSSVEVQKTDYDNGSPVDFYSGDFQEASRYFMTLKNGPASHQFVAHLRDARPDQNSGKDMNLFVRTLVNFKAVSHQ